MEKNELFQIISYLPLPSDLTFKIFNLYREKVIDEVKKTLILADEYIKAFRSSNSTLVQIVQYYLAENEKCSEIIYEFRSEARCLIISELYKVIHYMLCNNSHCLRNEKLWNAISSKTENLIEQTKEAYDEGRLTKNRYLETIDNLSKVKKIMNPVDPWFPF